ncbi:hypothetical protein PHMEG_00010679 [Phytophthora megakarya]|uniref:Uncharacterized protein n=1 Tax=Phytophthora megakarya TaxID=4795 RepID=A0A225WD53_9STRA|nr:hypothetical protein PHMEG_00010679 [Phytophthora megakarya]
MILIRLSNMEVILSKLGPFQQAFHRLNSFVYTYKTRCAIINLTTNGISPILNPEIYVLLGVGMAASHVHNMLFKSLRDPVMLAIIPETKKIENRKAYLKGKARDGWEITKF